MDFQCWISTKRSQVLWLSGPPECHIHDALMHMVDLIKKQVASTEYTVLYFFCSAVAKEEPVATIFVRALLQQIVRSFPPQKQKIAVNVFLRTLFHTILRKQSDPNSWLSRFKGEDSPDEIVRYLLNATCNEQWDALKAVLDIEHKQELSLIIDGLDKIEKQNEKFITDIRSFIEHLQDRVKIKVLLTSRPTAEIKELLDGLTCIEFDKERKGLTILFL
jgi:hypothetical protein